MADIAPSPVAARYSKLAKRLQDLRAADRWHSDEADELLDECDELWRMMTREERISFEAEAARRNCANKEGEVVDG